MKTSGMFKSFRLLLLLLLGIVWTVQSVSAGVYSLNAVGILQMPLSAGKPHLLSIQLIPVNETGSLFTADQVFGTNAIPIATTLQLMGADRQVVTAETFDGTNWVPGTNRLQRGQGVWVTASTNFTLRMIGNVPDSRTAATTTVALASGMQMVGYPYPVSGQFSNGLIAAASDGDVVLQLDDQGQVSTNFAPATYSSASGGWGPSESTFEIGEAWFYRTFKTNEMWTTEKPYEYP